MFRRIYIHVPFCQKKCPYCSFVSSQPQGNDLDDYVTLLIREMSLVGEAQGNAAGQLIDSLYFGGGTPSLLSAEQIARIITVAGEHFNVSDAAEVSLEANPGTINQSRLEALRESGINRLSLGIQSFNDHFLVGLGRIHHAGQALEAFSHARRAGFTNIGIDLINTLPEQTVSQWHADLQQALQLLPEHISVYGLTIEEGTPFAHYHPVGLPDDDISAEMFELADDLLTTAGFEHYEIANYARPAFRSRHNSGYWRREGYLGLGVAAHSMLKKGYGVRCNNPDSLTEYGEAISAGRLPCRDTMLLSREDAMAEFLFLGLRLAEGIDAGVFEREFECDFHRLYGTIVDELVGGGLLQKDANVLRLTRHGMLLSNQVFSRFMP